MSAGRRENRAGIAHVGIRARATTGVVAARRPAPSPISSVCETLQTYPPSSPSPPRPAQKDDLLITRCNLHDNNNGYQHHRASKIIPGVTTHAD